MPALESKTKSLRSELQALKDDLSSLKEDLESKTEISAVLNRQAGSCDLYDSGMRELDNLRNDLKKEQNSLEGSSASIFLFHFLRTHVEQLFIGGQGL